MLNFEEAWRIADKFRMEHCRGCIYVVVTDIPDRWAFTFSVFSLEDGRVMTPPPSIFVDKKTGEVNWFSIPPIENVYLLGTGKSYYFEVTDHGITNMQPFTAG